MTAVANSQPSRPSPRGLFWAFVPVILLGSTLVGLGTAAHIATRDPGFALETDYYQRAVQWNAQQARWAENERLGYTLAFAVAGESLVVTLRDRDGQPLRGATLTAEAFSNARAAARRSLEFVEGDGGEYRVALPHARPGLWEFRLDAAKDGRHFTQVERADVGVSEGGP